MPTDTEISNVDYEAIGRRIKEKRRERNITQERLAETMNISIAYLFSQNSTIRISPTVPNYTLQRASWQNKSKIFYDIPKHAPHNMTHLHNVPAHILWRVE